jgi:putative heme-binding domain-containing protein
MLIAAGDQGGSYLAQLLADPISLNANVSDSARFVADVARLAAAASQESQHEIAVNALIRNPEYCLTGLASFLSERLRGGSSIESVRRQLSDATRAKFDGVLTTARIAAADASRSEPARRAAIGLTGLAGGAEELTAIALNDPAQSIRLQAISALSKAAPLEPWRALLDHFASDPPAIQRAVLDGLFARGDRLSLLLDEVAAGRIKPAALDAAHMTQLLKHRDESIRQRAEKLFAAAIPADRQRVLADYQIALTLNADPLRGREVFAKNCATCHKIGDLGVSVGPDISDSRERTPAQYLTDILQPNRAVDSNFFSYTAVTAEGLAITGILTSETATTVSLKEASNKSTTLRREDIEQLTSNGVSLMPEGLEKEIPPQSMADLIGFIKNWRYLDGVQ